MWFSLRRPSALSRAGLASLMALAVIVSVLAPQQPARAATIPSGLPTHFGFGLGASPDNSGIYGYMPQMGVSWDYAMQYLSGGVNTNAGWETWNASGQFALSYATGASSKGYIPVFPYYELLQSSGTCGSCGENQKDISNLNNASVMNAYYANFALLMQRLGPGTNGGIQGFGKTALVNIEPDFTGGYAFQAANSGTCFGFCTAQGNDPSFLKAAVASSGYTAVAGYPNTYAGFVQALAHLRDLYAPNVLIGLDVSPWATGTDIGMDTSTTTNGAALGQSVGTFLSKTGPHDVLFNNPLDRDAGQYQALYGQNRWWDRSNVTFPNFKRWEQFLQGAGQADANRSMLLWQVPDGNQYFDTENNTNNHYQDNRAEYIFSHVPELLQSGIVGAIFMPGNAGNTNFNDGSGDGVTNPASFCTSNGISSGQVCNNHTSTVADDDGGYLRMAGQAYYASPVAVSGGGSATSTPTPTATSTQVAPATYTTKSTASPASVAPGGTPSFASTVTSSAAATVLVDVEIYDAAGTKVFQQSWDNQTFTAGQTRSYASSWQVPATAAAGKYSVAMGIFAPGWGPMSAWNATAGTLTVASSAATSTPTATPSPVPTNTPTSVPTNTPTSLPTSTPSPTTAPVSATYTTGATVAPSSVARGTTEAIKASVKSSAASSVLIDVEVYTAAGVKVAQQTWNSQAFTAGQTRTFALNWAVPTTATTGTYIVKVGVFSPNWGTLYSWSDRAATFTVK